MMTHYNNWILKTGLLYNSNFGKDIILPLLGTTYYNNGFIIDIMIPQKMELRYLFSKKLHFLTFGRTSYLSYYDDSIQEGIEISGMEFGARGEYQIYKWTWFHLGLRYYMASTIKRLEHGSMLGKVQENYGLNIGLIIRL